MNLMNELRAENFVQQEPDSHFYTSLEMIAEYAKWKGYGELLVGIKNSIERGYRIESPIIDPTLDPTPEKIIHVVCEVCGITEEDLKSRSRLREVTDARKIASYHIYSVVSNQRITGICIGKKNHSSISSQLKTYNDFYKTDKAFRAKAVKVKELLKETL